VSYEERQVERRKDIEKEPLFLKNVAPVVIATADKTSKLKGLRSLAYKSNLERASAALQQSDSHKTITGVRLKKRMRSCEDGIKNNKRLRVGENGPEHSHRIPDTTVLPSTYIEDAEVVKVKETMDNEDTANCSRRSLVSNYSDSDTSSEVGT